MLSLPDRSKPASAGRRDERDASRCRQRGFRPNASTGRLSKTKESNWKTQTAAMNAQGYVAGLGIPAPRERELKMCLD